MNGRAYLFGLSVPALLSSLSRYVCCGTAVALQYAEMQGAPRLLLLARVILPPLLLNICSLYLKRKALQAGRRPPLRPQQGEGVHPSGRTSD